MSDAERPTVVFLHGLGRTSRSLDRLRRRVEAAGWPTWARTYPSLMLPIPDLAARVADWIEEEVPDRPLLAVTHSLGGVLVRHMVSRLDWRGVLMIAPPNRGSRVARAIEANPLFTWVMGPVGQEVGHPQEWPPPPRPTGVVAGTLGPSLGNPPSWLAKALDLLPADETNDGLLTVDETRVDGGEDAFATVPASHTWIMNHPRTVQLVLRFLARGSFEPE